MKSNLGVALEYLSKGWSVIPIAKGTKTASVKWEQYSHKLPTKVEVTAWWTQHPQNGIAVVCGKVSGIIVVDIDTGHGKVNLTGLELPPTLLSRTGSGGSHMIYKWRDSLTDTKIGYRERLDIKSNSSYIVLPPSIHPNGIAYEWMNEGEPLTDAPMWLEKSEQVNNKTDWEKFFNETKAQGLRNMSATQLAGKILYETSPEMWDTLGLMSFRQWNKELNNPSLPEKELMTIWQSIKKTHIKNTKPPEKLGIPATDTEKEEQEIVKQFIKNKTKGTFYVAKYLTQKYNIITVGEKEREMYVYQNGVYFRSENEIIYPEIQRILGEHITKNAKTETFHKIADMTSHPRSILDSAAPNFIPLANGVYDLNTSQLLPQSPEYRFTSQLPITYNATTDCPKSKAFFTDILTTDQLLTVQEWIGYYFYRTYMFKKAIIFVGEGDTGKTTLLEAIIHLIGKKNISSVSLQKMTGDKFAAAHLYGKHGNLVDELSGKDIADTGNFKIATGGGSISGEYKFGNQFSFQNFSKFTFACNRIPDVEDFDDDAYFNRWIVIRFENTIAKKIPNFIATLTTEEERSGLFNFAMEGLRRLLAQGGFTYGKNATETKLEMMRSGSSIALFTTQCIEQDPDSEVTKEDMYDAYSKFCVDNGLSAVTMKMFGTKLPYYSQYTTDGVITISTGKRARGWRGAKLVTEKEVQSAEQIASEISFNKM